jgi:hypothetical protein
LPETTRFTTTINGAILAHIALETAPYPILRYGIRELKQIISDKLEMYERVIGSAPASGAIQYSDPDTARELDAAHAKIELLKCAVAKLGHLMDTTGPNDTDKVYSVARHAQGTALLLSDLEQMHLFEMMVQKAHPAHKLMQ